MSSAGAAIDSPSLIALYREAIRRHAAEPCGYGRAIEATHAHEEYNALCGDRVRVRLQVRADSVTDAAFEGEACAICMASASLLCELAPGETVEGMRQLADALANALRPPTTVGAYSSAKSASGDAVARKQRNPSRMNPLPQTGDETGIPGALHPLLGVRPYPSRVRCATLPWEAAVAALAGVQAGS